MRNFSQNFSATQNLIQSRLDKLNQERLLYQKIPKNYPNYYQNDLSGLYNLRSLSNARNQIMNPNIYSYRFMDPIYYPLEMPVNGEPIALPRIEMGGPVDNNCGVNQGGCGSCGNGLCMQDLLILLNGLGDVKLPNIKNVDFKNQNFPLPEKKKTVKRKDILNEDRKNPVDDIENSENNDLEKKNVIIPRNKKKIENKGNVKEKKNWWKLAKNFVDMYNFISTARKYTKYATEYRNGFIAERFKEIGSEIEALKEWIISIEKPFWEEFEIFEDLDLSFKNIDSKMKIQKQSQKLIALIKKYLENLISRKIRDIPEHIQKILYKYIKERAFYPKSYLSIFQINRLDFHFYGGTRFMNDERGGLILAYLIICGVTVQQILLHIHEVFPRYKNLPYVIKSAKFIGSVLHYLTKDSFQNNPQIHKEIWALLNYYRNYHLFNEEDEKQNILENDNNMTYNDEDQFDEFLEPRSDITSFWNMNESFVDTYKNFVFGWATNLSKLLRMKFSKKDPTLKPRKRLYRPPDKTIEYDVKIGHQM